MREIILRIDKIKNKKKCDYVVSGSIAGCTAEKIQDPNDRNIILKIPGKVYSYICDLPDYIQSVYVVDGHTEIYLPDFMESANLTLLIGG